MADQKQFRDGTTAEHGAFTGALAEVTVDTDKNIVVVHDGDTPGGFPAARSGVADVDVAGSGDITLSGSATGAETLRLHGTRTADGAVIVPDTARKYTVIGDWSGDYTLTVKTSDGTGVDIESGDEPVVRSDGTNVELVSRGATQDDERFARVGSTTASISGTTLTVPAGQTLCVLDWDGLSNETIETIDLSWAEDGQIVSVEVPRTIADTGGTANALGNYVQFSHDAASGNVLCRANANADYRAYPDANDSSGDNAALYERVDVQKRGDEVHLVRLPDPRRDVVGSATYIRYANNHQECFEDLTLTYNSSAKVNTTWTFPAAFSDEPIVNHTVGTTADASPSTGDAGLTQALNVSTTSAELRQYRVNYSGTTDYQSGDTLPTRATALAAWR